jgi:hypothetical protein
MADSSVAADVTKILNEEVANQAAIWSGTCGRNDGYCPGNDLINNTAADLTVEPLASPLRRGQLIATCNRIVTTRSSKAVDLLVRHVTKTFAKPTKQHVQDMWFWFYPTSAAPSEATLNAFVSLVEKMNTDKKTVLEIWTLVVDVMCRQPNGETL